MTARPSFPLSRLWEGLSSATKLTTGDLRSQGLNSYATKTLYQVQCSGEYAAAKICLSTFELGKVLCPLIFFCRETEKESTLMSTLLPSRVRAPQCGKSSSPADSLSFIPIFPSVPPLLPSSSSSSSSSFRCVCDPTLLSFPRPLPLLPFHILGACLVRAPQWAHMGKKKGVRCSGAM